MLEDNSYVGNPLRKQSRNIKLNINILIYMIYFFPLLFWDGLIPCITLYTTKPCGFLQPRRSFLSASYSITDTNNDYSWRKEM